MKKGVKVLSVIFFSLSILLSPMIEPFTISANTSLTAPFLGVNVTVIDAERNYSRLNTQNLTFEQNGTVSYVCQNYDSNTGGCSRYNEVQNGYPTEYVIESNISLTSSIYYVYEYEIVLDNYYVGSVNLNGTEYFINGTSFIFTTSSTVSTFTFSNVDLYALDNNKSYWAFPVESYPSINYLFNQGFEQVGIDSNNNFLYPIFKSNTDGYVSNNYVNDSGVILIMILPSGISSVNSFNNYFSYNSNLSITFKNIFVASGTRVAQIIFNKIDNSLTTQLNLKCKNVDFKFSNLYTNVVYDQFNVSLEFALTFGLNNELLDNIKIIAQGTNSSNNSVSDLTDQNNDLDNTTDDIYNLEDTFNNDFNTNIQAVDTSTDLTSFGTGFNNAALWVRNQYESITNNTIYGHLIGFSLIFGLALMIIGKWFG